MSRIDDLFARSCVGDHEAFEAWLGEVEIPLRLSLQRWARAVDVEGVLQETMLRVWIFAGERGEELEGENASLRWALGVARNVARNEARRFGREEPVPPEDLPGPEVPSPPLPDPPLMRIIRACVEAVSSKPQAALRARIEQGHALPDSSLAEALGMTLNTFRQNIVRARKQVAGCLSRHGAPLEEILP